MSLFIQVSRQGEAMGIWKISDQVARRVEGMSATPSTQVTAKSGEDIFEAMKRELPVWFGPSGSCELHPMKLNIGDYYPRMARPSNSHPGDGPGISPSSRDHPNQIAIMRGQLIVLMRQLVRVTQTIYPCSENFDAYGHDIRNLLILACTEVEAHWRGVLVENGAQTKQFTTKDYVKLVNPMKLREYAVSFPNYPWLEPIRPFERWATGGSPTQELPWYRAYNVVKHDRESSFAESKFICAFQAVTACAVMMCAQFGAAEGFGRDSELRYFFSLAQVPKWHPSEVYIHPYEGHASGWSPRQYSF